MISENIEADSVLIIRAYRALLKACKPNITTESKNLIRKAFQFSMEAHRGMRRKSGEPYIIHPLEVATICVREIGLGSKSIIAALLHDVVEDTEVTLEEIEELFGSKIAMIIDGLTKISGLVGKTDSLQAENFKKILLTLGEDVRVILIKLADRLHNMRTLGSLGKEKQLKIASETLFLFAPLAHRLGLYAVKSELEDLALKYTEPEIFNEITEKLQSSKAQRNRSIKKFIAPIEERLSETDLKYTIKGRPKSIYSIYNKMKRQNIPFEEVYDIFAIRVIVDTDLIHEKEACWRIYSSISDIYKPKPERLRDWISVPKFNGYESLHTTVMGGHGRWVEVQIRSERMDQVAEKGYAAHWKYKEGKIDSEHGLDEWLSHVRELLDNAELTKTDSLDFLDSIKLNLFSEEIYVFTPKGEMKTLPVGATALDFAFEIHSDVGMHCIGAKVNHKLMALNQVLKNGDQVEILTSRKQVPNDSWLKMVVTAKAETKIRHSLKEEKRKQIIDGKEIIKTKLEKLNIGIDKKILENLARHFELKSVTTLYYQIGIGKIEKTDITKAVKSIDINTLGDSVPLPTNRIRNKLNDDDYKKLKSTDLIIGDDDIGMAYKFAQCCNPVPGDPIFGFVTIHDGIKIHRSNCPNASSMRSKFDYRVIPAKWSAEEVASTRTYPAGIKVEGIDSLGIVSQVSNIISQQLGINMKSFAFTAEGGAYNGSIILEVENTHTLLSLIKQITDVEGVQKVSRFQVDESLG